MADEQEIIQAIEEAQEIGKKKTRAIQHLSVYVILAMIVLGLGSALGQFLYSQYQTTQLRKSQIANCEFLSDLINRYAQQYGQIFIHAQITIRKDPGNVFAHETILAFKEFKPVKPPKTCNPLPTEFRPEGD